MIWQEGKFASDANFPLGETAELELESATVPLIEGVFRRHLQAERDAAPAGITWMQDHAPGSPSVIRGSTTGAPGFGR